MAELLGPFASLQRARDRPVNELVMPAEAAHVEAILPLMAPGERQKLGGADLAQVIAASRLSWCALHDGQPMAVGSLTKQGVIWMISTPELHRQKRFFLRASRQVMAAVGVTVPEVRAYVDTSYTRSLRWLRWLGYAQIDRPRELWAGTMVQALEWRA